MAEFPKSLSRIAAACIACLVVGGSAGVVAETWLDSLAQRAMTRWEVPGLAVAVVRGDQVLITRVFGYRDVATREPVTPQTLFAIGSIAKSFTAVGLALLAAEGRLDWHAPVNKVLPGFVLRRWSNARAVSIADLLAHRTGLPRHDALWYLHTYSRRQLIYRLRFLDPFAPPGSSFQYSNLMVMVAGQAAGHVAGLSWEEFTRRRLLEPLGIDGVRLTLASFVAEGNRAQGYFPADQGRITIAPRNTDAIAPAAAIYAHLGDMTRWLRFLVQRGALDRRRLLPRPAFDALIEPWSGIVDPAQPPRFAETRYGLGFYLTRYRGLRLIRHPGVMDGYAALLSFMPKTGLGIVVLTNLSGDNPAPTAITFGIYDHLLKLTSLPWIEQFPSAAQRRQTRTSTARGLPTDPKPPPAHAIAAYAGLYVHPAYGTIRIVPASGRDLWGRLHGLAFRLRHAGGEVWRLTETRWPLREGLNFRFERARDGRRIRLATPLADGPTYRHNPGYLNFDRLISSPDLSDGRDRTSSPNEHGGEHDQDH